MSIRAIKRNILKRQGKLPLWKKIRSRFGEKIFSQLYENHKRAKYLKRMREGIVHEG